MTFQQVKVVLLGDSGVGKTCILNKFIAEDYRDNEQSTIGAVFMGKIIDFEGIPIKFNIWDTAGQERYQSLAKLYYRDADAVILVYDITNKKTFEALQKWVNELNKNGPSSIFKIVVGNKEDMINKEEILPEEAFIYAQSIGAAFTKTSAKSSYGIEGVFRTICENVKIPQRTESKVKISNSESIKKKRKCCEMEKSPKAVDVPRLVRLIKTEGRQREKGNIKKVFPYIENCTEKPSFPLYSRHGVCPVHDHKETYKEVIFDFRPRRIVLKNTSSVPLDLSINEKTAERAPRISEPPNTTKAWRYSSPKNERRKLKKSVYEYDFYEDRFGVGEERPVVICVTRRQKRVV